MAWRFSVRAEGSRCGRVNIYDDIDWYGVDLIVLSEEVEALGPIDELHVHINSRGGDVFEGLGMFEYLRSHPAKVTTFVDGIAGSMASVVAEAGDEVVIAENGFFFLHKPWQWSGGNADQLRESAELLDMIETQMIAAYRNKVPQSPEALGELLRDRTWMNASLAIEHGFATRVGEPVSVQASLEGRNLDLGEVPEEAQVFLRVESEEAPQAATEDATEEPPAEPESTPEGEPDASPSAALSAACPDCDESHDFDLVAWVGESDATHWGTCAKTGNPVFFNLQPLAGLPNSGEDADDQHLELASEDLELDLLKGLNEAFDEQLIEESGELPTQ